MIRRLKPLGSPGHLLGTDELGRDMLTRLIYGGRLSLFMGVTPVVCALVIGGLLGISAGYVGGWVNTLDHAHDGRVLCLPVRAAGDRALGRHGAGILNSLISLTLVFIPPIARVAESVTTQVRTSISWRPRGRPAPDRSPSCASTCSATCWVRSSSTPPA